MRPDVVRYGSFYRTSDSRRVYRFRCNQCARTFSYATSHPCYQQKKRQMNDHVRKHFASGTSLRRMAILFHLSRTTVARKLKFLAAQARISLTEELESLPPAISIEFDDLETFEHTKYKPVSVTLVVESKTRRILGFTVANMNTKIKNPYLAKKYPRRKDQRGRKRRELFERIVPFVSTTDLVIRSDQNPFYPADVKEFFPHATHLTFKSKRAASVGQGELKKAAYDPIFTINHTFAMFRANVNRLFRKTWCTTKRTDRLADHLAIYSQFHNQTLIPQQR